MMLLTYGKLALFNLQIEQMKLKGFPLWQSDLECLRSLPRVEVFSTLGVAILIFCHFFMQMVSRI